MLTLLEPPGAKRSQAPSNRSAQHLLNLAPCEEDEFYDVDNDYDPVNEPIPPSRNSFINFLDRYLVWQSSSHDYNDVWKREFTQRPSFCDADLCLQQVKRGRAKGNKYALYSRSFIQKLLFSLGNFVQKHAGAVLCTVLLLFSLCCYGLQFVHIETDIVKLWVSQGGRLDGELNFLSRIQNNSKYNNTDNMEIVRENGLGGGYQVIIQTPEYPDQNVLSAEGLLKHVKIMEEIATMQVEVGGSNWTLHDICFKPAAPLGEDAVAKTFEHVIERIVPCIWITPIDCFWEGAKALGPYPAVDKISIPMISLLSSLPDKKYVKWSNFDPMAVVEEINGALPLGTFHTFFGRAGLGHGYLDRPCMNPLDPECPSLAANYYNVCSLVNKFEEFTTKNGINIVYQEEETGPGLMDLLGSIWKRDAGFGPEGGDVAEEGVDEDKVEATTTTTNTTSTTTTTTTSAPTTTTTKAPVDMAKKCSLMRIGMMEWMDKNRDRWSEFLEEHEYPQFPDYGKVMSNGCPGFAPAVLHWPEDMILGGAKREQEGEPLKTADALQSVFLVASPHDVYLRFRNRINMSEADAKKYQTARNIPEWNEDIAAEVIKSWQRNFTSKMYGHVDNFDAEGVERRTIHPLASTSIADMLEEFCQFNYTIIFVGYGLMLVYAMATQSKRDGCLPASDSCMGLALAGVLTVTYASVAGLGLATWFGIEFNAATTQIVPFLTLGIGVDNMFMLLHNYHDVFLMTEKQELGILLRETGMSLLCTSINNILSFLAGTLLPIPALRSFCAQSTILLTFNFIAMLTVYPAIIAIDIRRRKSGMRDVFCCLPGKRPGNSYSVISKPRMQQKRTIGEHNSCPDFPTTYKSLDDEIETTGFTLQAFIRKYYIPLLNRKSFKIGVLFGSCLLLSLAFIGMQRANIGLELSDVLPQHTAPAQFLQARDKYFSFYPMFAVLQGPLDFPRQQHLIDNYRDAIGQSKFVIKRDGKPTEKYWLQMMKDWLQSIQKHFDEAVERGFIDPLTGEILDNKTITDDAILGKKLLCSRGDVYDCSGGRLSTVKLVDKSGTIVLDGFYNCLTAWFNQDNMMYYVSQASFYPAPPKWSLNRTDETLVPPAEPLAYSQIPFYLTGLTDTRAIVTMIEEVRGVCDNFTSAGLPNFPSGIAFTFWEQYLHLTGNLLQAIAIIALAVFVVISVLLFNPWAAMSVLVILVAMTIELAGFLGWAGIKMNPVSAVTLITAVGIGVEFTAHVVLAYLTALGSRPERTAAAVDRVFVPVIHGAFSTLLGILMLGFSEFEFVVKYFFIVMSALIVIGIINGLILLPVLLYYAGPPMEVRPINDSLSGRKRLPLPPPLQRPLRSNNDTDDEEDGHDGLTMKRRGHH